MYMYLLFYYMTYMNVQVQHKIQTTFPRFHHTKNLNYGSQDFIIHVHKIQTTFPPRFHIYK